MTEFTAHYFLQAAIRILARSQGEEGQRDFSIYNDQIDYEMFKIDLALVGDMAIGQNILSKTLPHSPVLLSPLAQPKTYNHAVHLSKSDRSTRQSQPVHLLIYRKKNGAVNSMELSPETYTMVLALQLASNQMIPLSAMELLLELAEYWNPDHVMHFMELGLRTFSKLNDLELVYSPEKHSYSSQMDTLSDKLQSIHCATGSSLQ